MATSFEKETLQLYMNLLRQQVRDEYRGHQDYHLMLNSIDSDFPMVGGDIKVQKQNKDGSFYTVTYHVTVKDDLGNFIKSIDDLGGQCMKGEIVKKGFIFTCIHCSKPFCRMHVKFVDDDPRKPLCNYGFAGMGGCYFSHAKRYSDGGINKIQQETKRLKVEADYYRAVKELKAVKKGKSAALPSNPNLKNRLLGGGVQGITCGNPSCSKYIELKGIICPNCRNSIEINNGSPLSCPICGEPVTQVECPFCEANNML